MGETLLWVGLIGIVVFAVLLGLFVGLARVILGGPVIDGSLKTTGRARAENEQLRARIRELNTPPGGSE